MTDTTTRSFGGQAIESTSEAFGELRPSDDVLDATDELRDRFRADGYLYLPGLLDCDTLLAARREMLERLDRQGFLDRNRPCERGNPRGPWIRNLPANPALPGAAVTSQ